MDEGCGFALTGLHGTNGIAIGANGTIYAADSLAGRIEVFERQGDNSLVHADSINTSGHIVKLACAEIQILSRTSA